MQTVCTICNYMMCARECASLVLSADWRALIPSVLTNNCFASDNGLFLCRNGEIRTKRMKIIAVFTRSWLKLCSTIFGGLEIEVEIFLCCCLFSLQTWKSKRTKTNFMGSLVLNVLWYICLFSKITIKTSLYYICIIWSYSSTIYEAKKNSKILDA